MKSGWAGGLMRDGGRIDIKMKLPLSEQDGEECKTRLRGKLEVKFWTH